MVSGFFVLLLVVGATLSFLNFLSPTSASWFPDFIATNCDDKATSIAVSRKLKENGSGTIKSSSYNKDDIGQVTLDDYNPIDPVPSSSKASINPGPIEHGTPLNPYIIPKPSPPNHPKPGDSN